MKLPPPCVDSAAPEPPMGLVLAKGEGEIGAASTLEDLAASFKKAPELKEGLFLSCF